MACFASKSGKQAEIHVANLLRILEKKSRWVFALWGYARISCVKDVADVADG
jgi:hypothetical protein